MLPLQLRVRSSVHHGGQLRRAARPRRRAHRNRRRRCRCFGRSARLAASSVASRLLGRQRGQPHLAAHPRPRAHRHRRRCRCSSRSLCRAASSVATPLLVAVGSFFVLLILGDVLLASPPTLSRRRRSSRRAASLPEAPDSCIVLRSPSAACIDITIAGAAVETAAALGVPLPLQQPLRSLHRCRGHLHRAVHPQRRASAIIAAAVKRAASRCLALPLRLPLRSLGRGDGQLHRAAHPQPRAYRNRRHRCRRRPFFVSRGLFNCLSAPRLATVDSFIVLPILSGVLLALAAAAVEAPAALRVALPLHPSILVRLVTVGSCIALLIIDGVLITIAAARRFPCHTASSAASLLPGSSRWAVAACCSGSAAGSSPSRRRRFDAPAAHRVAPPLRLPLRSLARHGGQLHRAAHPRWRAHRHRHRCCRYRGRSAGLAASSAASPLRGSSDTVGSCIVLLALGDVLLAIGAAAVETAAAVRAVLPLRLSLRPLALVAVGGCSVLLTLRGVLIAIAAAAVDTAAALRVALPLQLPLRSLARHGLQPPLSWLRPLLVSCCLFSRRPFFVSSRRAVATCCSSSAACSSPSTMTLSRRRPLFVSRCLLGCLSAPWVVAVVNCIMRLALSGLHIAIAVAAVEAPATPRSRCLFGCLSAPWVVALPLLPSSRHGGRLLAAAHLQRRACRLFGLSR